MKIRILLFTILVALALNTAYGRYVTLVINTDASSGEPLTPTNSVSIKFNEAARIVSTLPGPYYYGGYSYTNAPLCLYTIKGISVLSEVYGMTVVGPATISIVPNPSWGLQGGKALVTIGIAPNLSSQYGRYVTLVINTDASSSEPVAPTNSISIKSNEAATIISTLPGPNYYYGGSYSNYSPVCLYTISGISVLSEVYGTMVVGPATIGIVPNPSWGLQGGKALATIAINPNPSRQNRSLILQPAGPGMPGMLPQILSREEQLILMHSIHEADPSGPPQPPLPQ